MKTITPMLVIIACLGCSGPYTRVVVIQPEEIVLPAGPDEARWYGMPKDSSLYRVPTVPNGYSETEAEQYLLGHYAGWEDEGDNVRLGIIPGQVEVESAIVDAQLVFENKTEAYKRGVVDGRKQAEKDFVIFRQQIEEKARTQNKELKATR